MKTRISVLLGACSAILFSANALAQSTYSALQLSGGYFTMLNNSGQLVGEDITGTNYVYTDANGLGLHTLETPAGFSANFSMTGYQSINNLGQVAGAYVALDGSTIQGFYTTTSGAVVSTMANGQPLPGISGINDKGQMVGFGGFGIGTPQTSQGGASWQPINALAGDMSNGNGYWVTGINNQGQMSGMAWSSTRDFATRFFASADGSTIIEPYNALNGSPDADWDLVSKNLNDKGQLVSTYVNADGYNRVYLTGPNGTGISTLDGLSNAFGLNNAGQVAGFGKDANGNQVAMITGDNGQGVIDLNTLYSIPGDSFTSAQGINDAGQVLAYTANGKEYLLTPVPEASTSALMLLGLCGLGLARRRKH
jgi:hypothetical protein